MGDPREERLAENEAIFRIANERMAGWEEQHEDEVSELYLCECSMRECQERVRLRREDYETVRSNPMHFFVLPGHELNEVETVVARHNGWLVVEKPSTVEDTMRATDPRS